MKKWGLILIFLLVPFFFFGCEKQNLKKLDTPTNLTVSAGGIVSFERVKDDEYYSIFIDDNEFIINKNNPRVELYRYEGVNYFEYNSSKLLPLTLGRNYKFSVQAHAKDKKSSNKSEVFNYVHNLKLDAPKNLSLANNNLTWQPISLADGYMVKVEFAGKQTDYTVGENSFNINQVLLEAGKYNFSVCTISNNENYENSDFCEPVQFSNILQLNKPNLSQVYYTEGQAFVKAAIDANANSVVANLNNSKFELALTENEILKKQDNLINLWEINLSALCQNFIEKTDAITLSLAANFASTGTENFYSISNFSNIVSVRNSIKLDAPSISLTGLQDDKFTLSWDNLDGDKISGYQVFVACADGLKTFTFDCNTNSITLDNFVAVAVKKLGKDNYLSSNLSTFESANEEQLGELDIVQKDEIVTLNELKEYANYYLVEIGDEVVELKQNSIDISSSINFADTIFVTVISEGKAAKTSSQTLQQIELDAPQNLKFSSLKAYQLTFDAVENALGYYVYVAGKSGENSTYTKLDQVFCSNQIDLSKYLTKVEEYDVCVQAISAQNGYADSQLSEPANVKKTQKLEKPIVLLTNPLTKEDDKYYLNFVGVEGAASFEILINYSQIFVQANSQNNLRADITKFVTTSGNYLIKIRAIPNPNNPLLLASDYFEYTLKIEIE